MVANDPREILCRLNQAVDHNGTGLTLTREEARVLRDLVSNLYGEMEGGFERYDAICLEIAFREFRRQEREGYDQP